MSFPQTWIMKAGPQPDVRGNMFHTSEHVRATHQEWNQALFSSLNQIQLVFYERLYKFPKEMTLQRAVA